LAERAAAALDMDYAGVDLMPASADPDSPGLQVIEVNGVAAWQGLQRVTRGFNIAQAIVDDLFDRKLAGHCAAGRRPQSLVAPLLASRVAGG